jgi:hypothetical protein
VLRCVFFVFALFSVVFFFFDFSLFFPAEAGHQSQKGFGGVFCTKQKTKKFFLHFGCFEVVLKCFEVI